MSDTDRLLPAEPIPDLDAYLHDGGGAGLLAASDMEPYDVMDMLRRAGLRGRGGAGFPTGIKWRSVVDLAAAEGSPIYLVANGAEGEPGTYKDRMLLMRNPYAVVEGVLIGLVTTQAHRGFICLKEKFLGPVARLRRALGEIQEAGWPRADFVEIVEGPDDYLYGEETAMLEVIEGKLAMPRHLPPYQKGLFSTTESANPTIVNNLESYGHVSKILRHGIDWFREAGTEDSPGTMIFTVVGDVAAPGVHELPLGTTLRELLDIAGAEDVLAVYSGTSNEVILPDMIDTELCFDAMRAAGSGLGSGGFVVYDTSRCIVQIAGALSRFLSRESCGQCLACNLNTGEITSLLAKLDAGDGTHRDLEEILKRCTIVTDQNRCYLPVGEQVMITSTVSAFEDHFTAHVGRACDAEPVPVPKIESIDDDSGEVVWAPERP